MSQRILVTGAARKSGTTTIAHLIDLSGEGLDVEPNVTRLPLQPGDVLSAYADVSKARKLPGYQPTTPVEEGISLFATWLEDHLMREQSCGS